MRLTVPRCSRWLRATAGSAPRVPSGGGVIGCSGRRVRLEGGHCLRVFRCLPVALQLPDRCCCRWGREWWWLVFVGVHAE